MKGTTVDTSRRRQLIDATVIAIHSFYRVLPSFFFITVVVVVVVVVVDASGNGAASGHGDKLSRP